MMKSELDLMTYYAQLDTARKDSRIEIIIELFSDNEISKETAIKRLIKLGLSEQEAEARLK